MSLLSPGDRPGYIKVPVKQPARQPAKAEVKRPNSGFYVCDQCGYSHDGGPISRAKWKIGLPAGHLYFCNHHFRVHCLSFMAHNYVMSEL